MRRAFGGGFRADAALEAVRRVRPWRVEGHVIELLGLVVRARVPLARLGEVVEIRQGEGDAVLAEVVAFRGEEVSLLPLGELEGIGPDASVIPLGRPLALRCGPDLLGRVLDGLGRPIDGGPPLGGMPLWPVDRPAPAPLTRAPVNRPLSLGIRAMDGLLTLGQGQRLGLFAGSGVGKSSLLGQIARQTSAEVVVIALVGERGREVGDFLEGSLGPEGRRRSVVVAATSDAPPLVRLRSAHVATALAEYFRHQGKGVLLMMDSLTRFARAQREVALAVGELPARQGYPPSVFSALPRLLERAGNDDRGSITALYTVLVAGGDMEEPIADEVRGILDGHVVLSRALAERGHYPAIDIPASLSRVMGRLVDPDHQAAAMALRAALATYEARRDLILLGAYKAGSDKATDRAMALLPGLEAFLRQSQDEASDLVTARDRLCAIMRGGFP